MYIQAESRHLKLVFKALRFVYDRQFRACMLTAVMFTAVSMRHPPSFSSEPLLHHKRSSSGYAWEEDGIPFYGTIQPRALGKDGVLRAAPISMTEC